MFWILFLVAASLVVLPGCASESGKLTPETTPLLQKSVPAVSKPAPVVEQPVSIAQNSSSAIGATTTSPVPPAGQIASPAVSGETELEDSLNLVENVSDFLASGGDKIFQLDSGNSDFNVENINVK